MTSNPAAGGRTHRDELTDLQWRILEIEAQRWRQAGAKENVIASELRISWVRYYRMLADMIDHPQARAEYPMMLARLRRATEARERLWSRRY